MFYHVHSHLLMRNYTFEEDWIQCNKCNEWAHEECVDIDPSNIYFYCDVCKNKERIENCWNIYPGLPAIF